MINFDRPVIDVEDKRVKPCNLLEYHGQHHFRAPQCLCPLLQKLGNGEELNNETAIVEKISGTGNNRITEYVAECASGRCGYSGVFHSKARETVNRRKTVSLDQAYGKFGIPEKYSLKSELFCRKRSRHSKLTIDI